ncbi:hypothetical protein [Herbaspirillum sp. alder98]|uniref:hypothetical protein n=1 Tax=Herbaspirillum sp. alder98 TaxID=2913096 RepID=UPI001CD8C20C|nr:hypothetical protein [Herbaspirillum sp. alder98]MCA1326296.1 hypothetical protein [Herbaspirillum sp. alder98]
MGWEIALIDKGFALASDFLAYIREKSERDHQLKMTKLKMAAQESKVMDAILDVSTQLDVAVRDIVRQVTEKIERDQWEKLVAQVKGLQTALDFEDEAMIRVAVANISDQIEYAKNRLNEKKTQWMGPWLVAESIRLVALRQIASSDKTVKLLDRYTKEFRINILNLGASPLLSSGNVPWLQIADFIEGRNEDVIPLIAEASASKAALSAPRKPRAVPAAKAKPAKAPKAAAKPSTGTVLNPAAAWPFPTGTAKR